MRDSYIENLLKTAKTIAVVGLSPKIASASYEVAGYMQSNGYRILPINPTRAGSVILGEHCYANLAEAVLATGLKIDIVNCFRKSADIPPIVDEAIAIDAGCVWMQLDIVNEVAAELAKKAGLHVVMNKCLKIEHATRAASKH